LTPFAELVGTLLALFSSAAFVVERMDEVEELATEEEEEAGAEEEVRGAEEEEPSI